MNRYTRDSEASPLLSYFQDDELLNTAVRKVAAAQCGATMDAEARNRATGQIVDDLSERYPFAVTSGEERLQACREIDAMIDTSARYLASMQAKYRIAMPYNIEVAMAMPDIEHTGRNLGGAVLKDPAVRNVCTNIAWRIARIQAYSSGLAQLDGGHEVDRCRGIISTWLDKHGKTVTPIALEEASHWMAQQIVKKANVLCRNEVAIIYMRNGDIPDPDFGEYDSRLLAKRNDMVRDYDKFTAAESTHNPASHTLTSDVMPQTDQDSQPPQQNNEMRIPRTVIGTSGKNGRKEETSRPTPKASSRDTGTKATLRNRIEHARQKLMDATHRQTPRGHETASRHHVTH